MTAPDQSSPDGALAPGLFAERQAMTEADAKSEMRSEPLGAWGTAQLAMKSEFISASLVNGEIVRLDNRIDEILIGTERAFLYTFSESGVWNKHPAAYKVVVDVLSGASAGANSAGTGGWAGGWDRVQFTGTELEDLPAAVAVTVGGGTSGGSTNAGGESSFGTFASATGATRDGYGSGGRTYKMRGGNGGVGAGALSNASPGTAGSNGPFSAGGSGGPIGTSGGSGGHGFSIEAGQIGTGSAGGGGGGAQGAGSGGKGGHGGWPSAPGGGGGAPGGAGGNGASGAVFVTVYVSDELGIPPSTPTNLVASNITSASARVTWDASIDDVMVKNYVLFLDGARYGVVNTNYHDFVGLSSATTYSVRVQAVDIGDNASGLSDPLSFTTLT